MAFITFVTPYKPVICGIADYSHFIVRECYPGTCDVVSFNLDNYGVPLHTEPAPLTTSVWYGIPNRDDFSAASILEGLKPHEDHVLWFQHEFGIWPDSARFVEMLRDLDQVKVISLHTLHFQSGETPYGLRRKEYRFLGTMLPHTDAITVFSDGVYEAVTSAFPEYSDKVHVLRHGTHVYPSIARMSRAKAKARIHEYLVNESDLDKVSKKNLKEQGVFLDPETTVIGTAGFITASKGTELLFQARNRLRQMLPPERKIAAVRAGFLRDPENSIDIKAATEYRINYNGPGEFFLETYVPADMFPIMLRAWDVSFYWPSDCTQSGIVAHALGAGATIACRDMEGVGETVKMAGGLTSADLDNLVAGTKDIILSPRLRNEISGRALQYAHDFSWRNQALAHFALAEQLCRCRVHGLVVPALPVATIADLIGQTPLVSSGETALVA